MISCWSQTWFPVVIHVHSRIQKLIRCAGGKAESPGTVLGVGYDEVNPELVLMPGSRVRTARLPGLPTMSPIISTRT